MKYLTQNYKRRIKEEFGIYGFKPYRNNFYRVTNDVFQGFYLHKSVSGRDCTIQFGVIPLCNDMGINKSCGGADHLKMFENNYGWFSYDRNDEKSIDKCIEEMIMYMKKYLMPYFEKANNAKDAYFATCDFQQKHYKNGVSYHYYSLFCMALKAGFYEKCVEHLLAMKKQTEHAYNRNKECFNDDLDSEYEKRIREKIKKIDYQLKQISERNTEYINNFIAENEKNALLNLGMLKK